MQDFSLGMVHPNHRVDQESQGHGRSCALKVREKTTNSHKGEEVGKSAAHRNTFSTGVFGTPYRLCSKFDLQVAMSFVTRPGVSHCRTSRLWQLVVGVLLKKHEWMQVSPSSQFANSLTPELLHTAMQKSGLRQNKHLPHPPPPLCPSVSQQAT